MKTTIAYELWVKKPKNIVLDYRIPDHLVGLNDDDSLRAADLKKFDEELRALGTSVEEKKASKVIWRLGFPGMILDTKEVSIGEDGAVYLGVVPIHPHRADLSFKYDKTVLRPVIPLTVTSVMRDKERGLVLAVRGGSVSAGSLATIPGGHVDYVHPRITDVRQSVYQEFEEEVGLPLSDSGSTVTQLGLMGNQDVPGINVLHVIDTNMDYIPIEKKWRNAKDRGEHSRLVHWKREDLEKFVKTGSAEIEGKTHTATGFFMQNFKYFLESGI